MQVKHFMCKILYENREKLKAYKKSYLSDALMIVETPIPKANNIKVTIGVAELVSCNETR